MVDDAQQSAVELRGVVKRYGSAPPAINNLELLIAAGEFMTFLGPSGSGKTTTLNAIAGFLSIDEGEIFIGGEDVSRVPPHKRDLGMVFQHYALFPHLTVLENVKFPLRRRGVSSAEAARRAREALDSVGLLAFEGRKPAQLSGGQQQRVAVARAIVYKPRVVLMDEPLGALDKRLREQVQGEIKRLHRELGLTFIYVTHDQEEALALSDRIAVFDSGDIAQVGTGVELYERPNSRFVANFLGESSMWRGQADADGFHFASGGGIPLDGHPVDPLARWLMVRPEHLELSPADANTTKPSRTGVVVETMYLGATARVVVRLEGDDEAIVRPPASHISLPRLGERVRVSWAPANSVLLRDS